jgi:hypothetical protein
MSVLVPKQGSVVLLGKLGGLVQMSLVTAPWLGLVGVSNR